MKQMTFTNAAHLKLHYSARDYTKPVNSFPLYNNISSRVTMPIAFIISNITSLSSRDRTLSCVRLRPFDFSALLLLLEDILMADIKPVDPQ